MGEQKWPHHSIWLGFFTRSQSAMAFHIKSSNRCNCAVSWSQSLELASSDASPKFPEQQAKDFHGLRDSRLPQGRQGGQTLRKKLSFQSLQASFRLRRVKTQIELGIKFSTSSAFSRSALSTASESPAMAPIHGSTASPLRGPPTRSTNNALPQRSGGARTGRAVHPIAATIVPFVLGDGFSTKKGGRQKKVGGNRADTAAKQNRFDIDL